MDLLHWIYITLPCRVIHWALPLHSFQQWIHLQIQQTIGEHFTSLNQQLERMQEELRQMQQLLDRHNRMCLEQKPVKEASTVCTNNPLFIDLTDCQSLVSPSYVTANQTFAFPSPDAISTPLHLKPGIPPPPPPPPPPVPRGQSSGTLPFRKPTTTTTRTGTRNLIPTLEQIQTIRRRLKKIP